jgi:hypothetical protein
MRVPVKIPRKIRVDIFFSAFKLLNFPQVIKESLHMSSQKGFFIPWVLVILVQFPAIKCGFSQTQLPGFSITENFLSDSNRRIPTDRINLDPALPDVKAIGRGMTSVTGWNGYMGMLNNPAYLTTDRVEVEIADAQVIIPQTTIKAINYLMSNKEALKNDFFLKEMEQGIYEYIRYYDDPVRRQEALAKIDNSSIKADDLLTNVIGTPTNPTRHGMMAFPNLKVQYKNFGFSVYNVTQVSFLVTAGNILNVMRNFHRRDDEAIQSELLIRMAGLVYDSYNAEGSIDAEALPIIYSVAASNTAFSVGYGYKYNEKLSLGANFNLYRRALSTSLIESADYDEALNIAFEGFKDPIWDFNLTVGMNYQPNERLSFGLVANNFLPSKDISGKLNLQLQSSDLDYEIIGDSWQDSVSIDLYSQTTNVEFPYSLSIPFLLSSGATWQPLPNLYIAGEWADMLARDNIRYSEYIERFRLGVEYSFLKEIVSLRTGMANLRPTIGGGISLPIWRFNLDLDMAYAHTKLTDSRATYIQLKIRYKHPDKKQD